MVLLGNGNGDAARHDHYNCMTVLAGRGCGTPFYAKAFP